MGALTDIGRRFLDTVAAGVPLRTAGLHFHHGDAARLTVALLIAASLAMVIVRSTIMRRTARERIGLPALPATRWASSSWSVLRHTPLLLLLAGLPWFIVAVADPYSSLVQESQNSPGRRICLMIDASTSMVRPFSAPTLHTGSSDLEPTFLTTVTAAERFVQLRTAGKYHDLISLVEFGDQAYVVTPFTNDYENIRMSLSLVGDYAEFASFPDQGTRIGRAIDQGVELFKTFDFLEAAGNLMIVFSDGEDSEVLDGARTVDSLVQHARAARVPIYFVRTRFDRTFGGVVSDASWKDAVEATGGRYYAAADEATLLHAIEDIDRLSAGRIDITQYVVQQPGFRPFTAVAAALWSLAAMLVLTVPHCRRFP